MANKDKMKIYNVYCYMMEEGKKEEPYPSDVITACNKNEVKKIIERKNKNYNKRKPNKRRVHLHSIILNKSVTTALRKMKRI